VTDTRREMTRAQFEEAAAYAYDNWWLTGEDSFLHVPSVMNVEGWNFYGHPGNEQLTEPQRVLMMWSDLVGQTSNGGFTQFVYNFRDTLRLAYQLIAKLEWPELFERFDRAFREQVGNPLNPQTQRLEWDSDDDLEEPPTEAAEAFDDWFYRDETKAASRIHVGDYIRRHRDDLCRLTD
jgi:Domain of unknown function (DUF4375)